MKVQDLPKRRFEALCKIADKYGINACFEFLPITEVKSLPAGLDIMQSVGHPRGKLMDRGAAARDIGVPIQTGADKYYVQNGLMDPTAIVPPPVKPAAKPPAKAERSERTLSRS